MYRKTLAYTSLAIAVPLIALTIYWMGGLVLGSEGAASNLFVVAILAIIFGAGYNELHPERTN